jgi:hypothetical protein
VYQRLYEFPTNHKGQSLTPATYRIISTREKRTTARGWWRKRYSRGWIELSDEAASDQIKKKTLLMNKLDIKTEKLYLNAFKAAKRGMVWVHLCDIFEDEFKDNKFVALCAFTGSCSMCIIISQDGLDINFNT